ncbi:hypothetical protein [Aurantiacibacter spongiae]|uniref:Bacterial surface antigen (D15) domain-containing protein n=1 Tax=Aurantiacibacter spongiae TaxID=2488860 RepID=A0A3N5DB68_9SPHN|nr:hypothetical protein [Aurantiacibacter spongiae]RPF71978.1 hypothetical protein EG799_10405 [Aurantiacibacter spongiae]
MARPVGVEGGGGALRLSPAPPGSRWSMDGWALLRRSEARSFAAGTPGYGGSQLGAVLRYRLSPSSRHAPQIHLRGSQALVGERESEVALGLSARPIATVPVRVAAEMRATADGRGLRPRAAFYAVSELAPLALPAGAVGEAYLQAGYVSGDFATAFVDGQARVTRAIVSFEGAALEVGGGAWGGAQEDAARLDIGPTAVARLSIGQVRARLAMDYRLRVAGDATPASGPALTLSAGF